MGKYEFNVKMTCGGCSGAVERALSKVEGITYNVDLEKQLVTVEGNVTEDEMLAKIKKTGKEVLSSKQVDEDLRTETVNLK